MTQTLRLIAASSALALVAAGCGSSATVVAQKTADRTPLAHDVVSRSSSVASSPARPISGHTTVAIRNYMFTPMRLTVTAGTKVSFHNEDKTAHTATAVKNTFDSGTIKPGKTSTVTFKKPGTYAYHCLFHEFMTATITVVPTKG